MSFGGGDLKGLVQNDLLDKKAAPKNLVKIRNKLAKKQKALLEKGRLFHLKGDFRNALDYYNQAWKHDENNLDLLTLVAYCLVQLNAREQTMDVVEKALKIHGANETLCQILGTLASNMNMHAIAEKIWRQAIALAPDNSVNYSNLLGSLYEQEKFDDVVSLAQQIIPVFPKSAGLWSILATAVQYTEHKALAPQFFEEALSIDPKFIPALNNYALMLGVTDRGMEVTKQALKYAPDSAELNVGYGIGLLSRGEFKEAWPHYRHRLNPNRSAGQNVHYQIPYPEWDQKPNPEKTIVVLSEQGIGDEVLFLSMIPTLMKDVKQVIVACDMRLIPTVKRSFPGVQAFPHYSVQKYGYVQRHYPEVEAYVAESKIENVSYIHLANIWEAYINRIEDIPVHKNGFFKPEPTRSKAFADFFAERPRRPRIGVSWRSGNITAQRAGHYLDKELIVNGLSGYDVDVVCLQYSATEEEHEYMAAHLGDRYVRFETVDLKTDIDANFAIMDNLDFTMGPGVATTNFSFAVGVETYYVARGRPWWNFGEPMKQTSCSYIPHLKWIINTTGTEPLDILFAEEMEEKLAEMGVKKV